MQRLSRHPNQRDTLIFCSYCNVVLFSRLSALRPPQAFVTFAKRRFVEESDNLRLSQLVFLWVQDWCKISWSRRDHERVKRSSGFLSPERVQRNFCAKRESFCKTILCDLRLSQVCYTRLKVVCL